MSFAKVDFRRRDWAIDRAIERCQEYDRFIGGSAAMWCFLPEKHPLVRSRYSDIDLFALIPDSGRPDNNPVITKSGVLISEFEPGEMSTKASVDFNYINPEVVNGTPTEVAETFDLDCCKAYITRYGELFVDERWIGYPKNKRFKIDRITDRTFHRVLKYTRKGMYLSASSLPMVLKCLMEMDDNDELEGWTDSHTVEFIFGGEYMKEDEYDEAVDREKAA